MVSKTASISRSTELVKKVHKVEYTNEDIGTAKRYKETVVLVPKLEPHHRANETKRYRNTAKSRNFTDYGWYKNTIFCDPNRKPLLFASTITAFDKTFPEYCSSRIYVPVEAAEKRYVYSMTETFFTAQFGGNEVTTTQVRAWNQHVTTVDRNRFSHTNYH